MTIGRKFLRLIGFPTRSAQAIDRDLDDEVSFHIEMRVQDLVRRGFGESDARRQAIDEFGDAERLKTSLGRLDRAAAVIRRPHGRSPLP